MSNRPIDQTILNEIQRDIDVQLDRDGDAWVLTMRRRLAQRPELVWRMLTEPDLLARWSPIVPDRPFTIVGPARSRENPGDESVDAEVLEVDPPRLLVHRWGSDTLRWSVSADGAGSILQLQQRSADRAYAASLAGGWQVCFGTLAAIGDGTERERVVGQRAMDYGWQELHDRYQARFAKAEE